MHKLLNRNTPITIDMFVTCEEDSDWWIDTVCELEKLRIGYKKIQTTTKNSEEMNRLLVRAKRMLTRGVFADENMGYKLCRIRNMYFQRKNHRLKKNGLIHFVNGLNHYHMQKN